MRIRVPRGPVAAAAAVVAVLAFASCGLASSPGVGAPGPGVDATRARKLRNPGVPWPEPDAAERPSGRPALLGQILANLLHRLPWPTTHVHPKCSDDVQAYGVHLRNGTMWAAKNLRKYLSLEYLNGREKVKERFIADILSLFEFILVGSLTLMLDATSKGPEGLLDGNIYGFGNFDQCVSTKSKSLNISGGYTLVDIDYRPNYELHPGSYNDDHSDVNIPLDDDQSAWTAISHKRIQDKFIQKHKFQWAVCLPDTCRYEDVQKMVSDILLPEMNRHGMEANVTIDPLLHTSSQNIYKYTTGFFIVCSIFIGIFGLVIAATLYDLIFLYYRPKQEHGSLKNIMRPFSLITNFERLLKPTDHREFSIINGYKFLFILQNIFGHRAYMEFGMPQANPNYMYEMSHSEWNGYFKCYVYLETFFLFSGFLNFSLLTKHLTKKKRLDFVPILIYRYLRIIPVYVTLIITYIFILPYLNDGPYWRKLIYRESERCRSNWWTNILFINNYVRSDEMCIIPSWYVACDMHFFIVGVLLTYVIWRWRNIGLTILGACLILSTGIPAYIILKEQHRGVFQDTPETYRDISKDRFFTEVYIKSHMRSMTYFAGIFIGYLYMRFKEANYRFSEQSMKFWVPIFTITSQLIYLSGGWFFLEGQKYVAYQHVLYFTLSRIMWSIIIGHALIGHGLTGLGIFLSDFLSHPAMHVLGKLVFCIYMFQELIQLQTIGSIRAPIYQQTNLLFWKFLADTFVALVYALVINVMIESPFDRLQKNFMSIFLGDKLPKTKLQQDTKSS